MYIDARAGAAVRRTCQGQEAVQLTANYAFGHDLLRVAKRFMQANGGTFAADDWSPTNVTDFLRLSSQDPQCQAGPRGFQPGRRTDHDFMKQYMEFGLPFPLAGSDRYRRCMGAGKGNVAGIWPLVWDFRSSSPTAQSFTAAFHQDARQAAGEPGWGDYLSTKHLAQAMNELKTPIRPRSRSTWKKARSSTC